MGTGGMTLQLFVTNHSEPREESCVCTLTGGQWEISMSNIGDRIRIFATVQSYAKQKRQAPHTAKGFV